MRRPPSGFTLVEVLLALFLIAVGVLAAAPMFMYAVRGNAVGADVGSASALAEERMELLRTTPFADLTEGGSLDDNVEGYFDDSTSGYTVRWQISTGAGPGLAKTIAVRAVVERPTAPAAKQITLTTLRAR